MPWKFVLHFNDVDNDSLIQHDIVYLEHTEKYFLNNILVKVSYQWTKDKSFLNKWNNLHKVQDWDFMNVYGKLKNTMKLTTLTFWDI